MKTLDRHLASHVLSAVLLVIVVLLGLFAVVLFAEELGDAPEHYRLASLAGYVALRLPGMAVANTGFAMLIGCLLGLGVLASQSELTVMRASGVSVQRIAWQVLRPMLVLMLVTTLAGEFAVPDIERQAGLLRAEKAAEEHLYNLIDKDHGMWLRQGNDFLHFNHVTARGDIYGFARLSFDDQGRLQYAQYASQAEYTGQSVSGDNRGASWLLKGMRLTRFAADSVSIEPQEADAHWYSELDPGLLKIVVSEPNGMSLRELYHYMHYLEEQDQDSRNFELVFWQKALQPVAMIGLVLVAISFIFGPLRDTTMGYRLFTGVMVGIVFRFSQDLLGPTSLVYGFPPLLAVSVPIVLCWLVGLFLLARTR